MENMDNRVQLSLENNKRLESLMGDSYDSMEMEDYLSYISPEQAKEEIDVFEEKLGKGHFSKEELENKFKKHLEYLAA